VAVCPQISYLRRGGRVAGTSLGELGAAGVTARVAALERHEALPG
jgi:ribosomal protein L13E